jgi:prepilin-type N-terminal cleavage/methylation domain-containing protein
METRRARKAFSLIELIIVIAIIAIITATVAIYVLGIVKAANVAADRRSAQLWNDTYTNVVGVEPSFGNLSWEGASANLANGVELMVSGTNMHFLASKPQFHGSGDPGFEPGVGIMNIPGEE